MLAFTDVMDLFANELARLCRRRLPGTLGSMSSLQCSFLRHTALPAVAKRNTDATSPLLSRVKMSYRVAR